MKNRYGPTTRSVGTRQPPDTGSGGAGLRSTLSSCATYTSGSGAIESPWRWRWRFQGRILESADGSTDLYDFQARSYDPSLGAFTSFDSVAGSAQNPLTLNRYLYALANPATLVDPDGHMARTYIYDADDQHRQSAASIAAARAAGQKYRDKLAADAEYEFMHRKSMPTTLSTGAVDKNSEAARRAKINKLEGYDVFDPFEALNHLESECSKNADRAACEARDAARAAIGPSEAQRAVSTAVDLAFTPGVTNGYCLDAGAGFGYGFGGSVCIYRGKDDKWGVTLGVTPIEGTAGFGASIFGSKQYSSASHVDELSGWASNSLLSGGEGVQVVGETTIGKAGDGQPVVTGGGGGGVGVGTPVEFTSGAQYTWVLFQW
jgi:RHS repeat-associated protein